VDDTKKEPNNLKPAVEVQPEDPNLKEAIEKNAGGRPVKYDSTMPERAFRLALLGLKNDDIALALGIRRTTFYDWMATKPKFSESIKRGQVDADVAVAASLYKRATGFEIEEEKLFAKAEVETKDDILRIKVKKYFQPETKAAEIWLRNRRPKEWRNVQTHEVSGPEGGPIQTTTLDASKLSDAALEELMRARTTKSSSEDNNS